MKDNLTEREKKKKKDYDDMGISCRKDYVRCEKCKKAVTSRASLLPEYALWLPECQECSEDNFSENEFSLVHFGNNKWAIRNSEGSYWCGTEHQWVDSGSSYYAAFPDLYPMHFDWDEAKDFVKRYFECIL